MAKKNQLVVLDPKQFGVQQSKAKQIKDTFDPMVEMLEGFEKDFNKIVSNKEITEEVCIKAKRLRLDISKVRIETDKIRKREKDESLRAGKAIDGVANILKYAVMDKEEKLKSIELHFENKRLEEVEKLRVERTEELEQYEVYNVDGLGEMDEVVYKNFLKGSKTNMEELREAERKAEEERLAKEEASALHYNRTLEIAPYIGHVSTELPEDLSVLTEEEFNLLIKNSIEVKKSYEENQELIRKENEKLKKEAEEREEKEEADRIERERLEEKERNDRAKEQEVLNLKLKKEREERERVEQELQDKFDQEAAEVKRIEEDEQAAALAPDKEKLSTWIGKMEIEMPEMSKKESKEVAQEIFDKFQGFKSWALKEVKNIK